MPLNHDAAGPRGQQSHAWLPGINPRMNHLRRCLAVCRPVHLVLHGGEKLRALLRFHPVADRDDDIEAVVADEIEPG